MELPAATKPTDANFVRVIRKKKVQWIKVVTKDSIGTFFFWIIYFLSFETSAPASCGYMILISPTMHYYKGSPPNSSHSKGHFSPCLWGMDPAVGSLEGVLHVKQLEFFVRNRHCICGSDVGLALRFPEMPRWLKIQFTLLGVCRVGADFFWFQKIPTNHRFLGV